MHRKSRKTERQNMSHHAGFLEGNGRDLFRRRRIRDLSCPDVAGRRRGLKGVNPSHAGFGMFMLLFGTASVALVMLNQISDLWFASLMSICGSFAVMAGVWILCDAVMERSSIDNLVRDAIIRALRERN